MRPYQNREKRIEFFEPLSISFDNEIADVHNMSLSGCLFQTRRWFKVDPLKYEISILPNGGNPVPCTGRVVRAKMVPEVNGISYEIGFQFDQSDSRIQNFKNWFHRILVNSGAALRVS